MQQQLQAISSSFSPSFLPTSSHCSHSWSTKELEVIPGFLIAAMAIPVIDFSKLDGDESEATLAELAAGFEEWGFFQVIKHMKTMLNNG